MAETSLMNLTLNSADMTCITACYNHKERIAYIKTSVLTDFLTLYCLILSTRHFLGKPNTEVRQEYMFRRYGNGLDPS